MKQIPLALGGEFSARKEHGGVVRQGRRKLARPLDPRRPVHVVMRSSRARDGWSMLRAGNERDIRALVYRYAHKNGVKIYRYANVGNHLHVLLIGKRRVGLSNFMRTIGAMIPRRVTGAKKGSPIGRFWDHLAYSRIVNWGRDFASTRRYVALNEAEVTGMASVSVRCGTAIRAKPT